MAQWKWTEDGQAATRVVEVNGLRGVARVRLNLGTGPMLNFEIQAESRTESQLELSVRYASTGDPATRDHDADQALSAALSRFEMLLAAFRSSFR